MDGTKTADTPIHPTRVLSSFLGGFGGRPQPVLLDLGPVVGQNVTFFGEEIGCKILVEDVSADIDKHVTQGAIDALPSFFEKRFPQESESIDGILCWDIFDYLEPAAAERLAGQLTRVLRPGALLFAFFGTAPPTLPPTYTRYTVVDRGHLVYRPYPAARGKQKPAANRDIQRLFSSLRVVENVLLKSHLREVLFRKPAAPAGGGPTP